MFKSVPGTNQY